ncbi:MAG: hypothetical protein ACJA00_000631 [Myxococcota bacterium]|jgi:hypothetical protein
MLSVAVALGGQTERVRQDYRLPRSTRSRFQHTQRS